MRFSDLSDITRGKLAKLGTPYFLFDLDTVERKVRLLQERLAPEAIFYAVKCNSLKRVLKRVLAAGCGLEVNNLNELNKAFEAGATPDRVINSSPITPAKDVREMFARGVNHFAFDSISMIENLSHNAPGAQVYLRIFTTNQGSKFDLSKRLGVPVNQAPDLLRLAKDSGLNPFGVTFHVGSQCLNLENWDLGLAQAAKIFEQFPELTTINVGGGLPIQYNGCVPEIDDIAKTINESIANHFKRRPIVHIEPGRFIVGDSAMACTTVTQLEERGQFTRAIVDLSVFTGLIELLENGWDFQYSIEADATGDKQLYRIGGASCAGTDIIKEEVWLPKLSVDHVHPGKSSRLYLFNVGAYTIDYICQLSEVHFNGSRTPKVLFTQDLS